MTTGPNPRHLALLLVLAGVLFTANLSGYDISPPDEPRYAQVAREMMERGDYLVPHVNGQPYKEKPPLLFWSIAAASWPFGDVTEVSARIPSVAAALITTGLTYLLAARLFGGRVAFWAALVLITNYRFWWNARIAQIDMLLTAGLALALYAFWRFEEARRPRWLLLAYGGIAAGMLAKGPPALIFPLLLIFTFYWRDPAGRKRTRWILGSVLVIAATAAWFIPARMLAADSAQEAMQSGIGGNLFRNTIGRMFLGVSKAQPPWYYLETIPVDFLPWSLFLPWTVWWVWKRRNDNQAMRFLWCYTVPALLFFSISVGKRAIYLLPLWPAIAILIAASVLALADSEHATWRRRTGQVWGLLLLLLGLVAVYSIPSVRHVPEHPEFSVLPLLALLFGGYALSRMRKRLEGRGVHVLIAGQFALLLFVVPWSVLPLVNEFKSAKSFCAPIRALSETGAAFRLYSVGFSREEYVFYSHHFHEELFTELVGVDPAQTDDLFAVAQQQKEARARIASAVEHVPILDLEAVQPDEIEALREAIERAVASSEDPAALRRFEDGLRAEVAAFTAAFTGETPAFLFVQAEDWRWLLPLQVPTPAYVVVKHQDVGSRNVLLLANPAAARLAGIEAPARPCRVAGPKGGDV